MSISWCRRIHFAAHLCFSSSLLNIVLSIRLNLYFVRYSVQQPEQSMHIRIEIVLSFFLSLVVFYVKEMKLLDFIATNVHKAHIVDKKSILLRDCMNCICIVLLIWIERWNGFQSYSMHWMNANILTNSLSMYENWRVKVANNTIDLLIQND